MTATLTLADFLLARIAEDEEAARICAEMFPSPWEVADRGWRVRIYSADVPDEGDHADPGDVRVPCVIEVEPTQHHNDMRWLSERVEHIARHDPARVLAECEAKRRIVDQLLRHERLVAANAEEHAKASSASPPDQERITALRTHGWELSGRLEALRMAVDALALPYASHPDYGPDWRP